MATRLGAAVTLDPAGHVTADGSGRSFVYNQAGQLYQVLKNNVLYATYSYNYQGQRTRKVTTASAPQGAQTILYQYDPQGHLLAELTGTGAPLRTYVWRDDTPLAQIEYVPARKVLYYEVDHLATPRAALDETGKVVWRWESDAFGTTAPNEDPDGDGIKTTVNLRFPGQYYDAESGLHYNYFRDYDPGTGRYVTSDPVSVGEHATRMSMWLQPVKLPQLIVQPDIGNATSFETHDISWLAQPSGFAATPLELNQYVYIANNPLRWTDSTGESIEGFGGFGGSPMSGGPQCGNDKNKNCAALRDNIINQTCKSIRNGKARMACFAAAWATYLACLAED